MDKIKNAANKIRLLHLVHSLGIGGAEIALFYYIKALGVEGYDHYVYCFKNDGPVRQKIEALGVPVYIGRNRDSIKHPIKFVASIILLLRGLLVFIKRKRIHIIQSHSGEANQLSVALGKISGVPVFPTVHSTMAFRDERSIWDLRVYLIKIVNWLVYRLADRVLAVSQQIKKIIRKRYNLDDSKVLVLKNGIVVEPNSSQGAGFETEFPSSSNKVRVIAVGRLVHSKNFDTLVKAVAEIAARGSIALFLVIVGDGEERPRLEKLIEDLGVASNIRLLGFRDDVLGLMKSCDLFVIPSLYEGLSIAMIEAMACGLPIIASSAPGLREHIENEKNGILFPVGDSKTLADCILKLSNDLELRAKLSEGARESFENEYDMHKNIKPLDLVFREYVHIT